MKKSGVVAPIIELWYSYNIQGRLTQVKRGSTVITEYIYDTNGQKIQKKMPVAGLDVLYGYNTAGYLVELVNRKGIDVVSRFKYTYDLDGNQKTKNDNFETAYVYDKLGRLVSETEELGNTYVYLYDNQSNRTKLTVTGLDKYTVDYTYDANNRLLKEVRTDKKATEASEYEYDANGNRISALTETIHAKSDVRRIERHSIVVAPREKGKASIDLRAYNPFGELVQIYRDAMRVHYVYRPDGLRHSKQQVYPFKPDLNQKTTHYWDGQDIVAEVNATGALKATYLRGAGSLIAQVIGPDLFYYLHNAHGDVVQRISEAGVSAPKYKYDAFGNERNLVVTDPNPFRYCGEYYDAELQEIYLRARSYDPLSGRFTQEDPAHDGNNWYGYANNNPIAYIDPSGTEVVGESKGNKKVPVKDNDYLVYYAAPVALPLISLVFPTAVELYNHSTSHDTVKNSTYDASSASTTYSFQHSSVMNDKMSETFDKYLSGTGTSSQYPVTLYGTMYLNPRSDPDLFLAFASCNYTIQITPLNWNVSTEVYRLDITITDTYDFLPYRLEDSLGNQLNNYGARLEDNEIITTYEVVVNYSILVFYNGRERWTYDMFNQVIYF